MTDTIESLRAELAAEKEARQRAEGERDAALNVIENWPGVGYVRDLEAQRDRLLAIEREAQALLANINDPRRQALDTRDLAAALEAK